MPTDTAPFDLTARTAAPVPVITSGEEATRAAHDFAAYLADGVIERDRACGALRDAGEFVRNYLLNHVLPPNRGQI